MVGYESCVAGDGLFLAYGLANCWTPTGWLAIAVPVIYTFVTYAAGSAIQTHLKTID